MAVGGDDARARELARLQRLRRLVGRQQADPAVDLGGVGVAAAPAAFPAERRRRVDQDLHRRADAFPQLRHRDVLGDAHEARAPLLAQLGRDHAGQRVRARARHRRIREAAGAIDPRLANEIEQMLELGVGLARKAGDEGAADDELRADLAPARQPLEVLLAARRPLHPPQHVGMRMLERHVEVRQDPARRHQRQHVVDVRVRIDVVQPDPGAVAGRDVGELLAQRQHLRLDRPPVPEAGAIADIDAVRARVLADDEELLDARLEQRRRLAEDIADRPRDEVAAQARDDAERAAMVAALADLQVGVVLRRQLDADRRRRRHQVEEGIVRLRHMRVHGIHHFLGGVRAGHREHARMHLANQVAAALARLRAEAAGDDDLAVGGERLADRVEALANRVVDEAAGVDDHQVGAGEGLRGGIALGAEARQDQLGVGERLRAAERDEADPRRGAGDGRRFQRGIGHPRIFADR